MLVFIDTNILLDFYRMGTGEGAKRPLKFLNTVRESIISTYQVEMEYKKHRQRIILDTQQLLSGLAPNNKTFSPLLLDTKPVATIKRSMALIEKQQKQIKKRMDRILLKPTENDPIYQHLQRLFKEESDLNLNRQNDARYSIRRLAFKRFMLGYPPRKAGDNSIGDAVNWEWVVNCAKRRKDDVVIVSRDNDFGVSHAGKRYINDWLSQEFKERVGRSKKVVLTDRLMDALETLKVRVSADDRRSEEALLRKSAEASVGREQ
jgi:hypothetical protein